MSGNAIIYLFRKLIALTISLLSIAQTLINIILRRNNSRISELPFHVKEKGTDIEYNTPIMDDISSSTIITSTAIPKNNYQNGGLTSNATVYDYQRSQMLQNQKRIEEAMRLKIQREEEERAKAEAQAAEEQDFFKDMTPEIKGRKLLIKNNMELESKPASNSGLFSVNDTNFLLPEVSLIKIYMYMY
uniref:Uncharacterized protein n=1 Tax=Parastrongyloides trichosuri TaxID=131310 RepID=A0A0N4ZW02_PARTI